MNIYTTSLPVSQRIQELVGEMESKYNWSVPVPERAETKHEMELLKQCEVMLSERSDWGDKFDNYKSFNLCQLPEVLKKAGEKLEWTVERQHLEWIMVCGYLFHGDNVGLDNYLMELLK